MTFAELVAAELERAREMYPEMHSLHEGYATILEEVEEMWDDIKRKPSQRCGTAILREAVQVAAMVQRMVEDCGLMPEADRAGADTGSGETVHTGEAGSHSGYLRHALTGWPRIVTTPDGGQAAAWTEEQARRLGGEEE